MTSAGIPTRHLFPAILMCHSIDATSSHPYIAVRLVISIKGLIPPISDRWPTKSTQFQTD